MATAVSWRMAKNGHGKFSKAHTSRIYPPLSAVMTGDEGILLMRPRIATIKVPHPKLCTKHSRSCEEDDDQQERMLTHSIIQALHRRREFLD